MKIKIEITQKELDIIANALAQMPYIQVAELISNLQNQVNGHHQSNDTKQ